MKTRPLGRTGLDVSVISLGSMNWGEQNDEAQAHAQLDAALDLGINFIDTAEMYPTPVRAETQGLSEAWIGSWLKARGSSARDQMLIATKVLGPRPEMTWVRGGNLKHDRASIEAAIDGSLQRLGVDVIDLYYIHWPERTTNTFGRWSYNPSDDAGATPMVDVMANLNAMVDAGKIKHVALSNETPWGLMEALKICDANGFARPACIQNTYNILNRTFEVGLAEVAIREDCGLACYSPLAGGNLTGKYLDGAAPKGSRGDLTPDRTQRYQTEQGLAATKAYAKIAADAGLSLTHLALAWAVSRPFMTSAIIGATSVAQVGEDAAAADIELGADVLDAIEDVHRLYPHPCP